METAVMLCDHADAVNGKLFVNGAAINVFWVAPQPPHAISAGIAMVIHVPYTATNQPHSVDVALVDEDGGAAIPWVPDGAPTPGPVRLTGNFNVGRPPNLAPGDSQTVPLAFNFQLPLTSLGRYEFTIDIDGSEVRRLPFRLELRP